MPVRPTQLVLAERQGHWHQGELRAWQQWQDGWHEFVCYAVAAGMRYLEWLPADRLRQPTLYVSG